NERVGQNAPTGEHLQYGSLRRASTREPGAGHAPWITQTACTRGTRTEKPATAGPPPGGSKLTSRPAPLRGAPAAAGAMPPATCRGRPGHLPPPPEGQAARLMSGD